MEEGEPVFCFQIRQQQQQQQQQQCWLWPVGRWRRACFRIDFSAKPRPKNVITLFSKFQLQDKNWLADQTSWHTNRPDKLLLTSNQVLPTSTKFCQLLPTSIKFFQFLPNLTNCCKVKVSDTATSTFVLCCLVENCLASGNLFASKLCWWPVWWQKAC